VESVQAPGKAQDPIDAPGSWRLHVPPCPDGNPQDRWRPERPRAGRGPTCSPSPSGVRRDGPARTVGRALAAVRPTAARAAPEPPALGPSRVR